MKFTCERNHLIEKINIVQKAVSLKSTLPILEGILLQADDNLKLTANDLEMGIECTIKSDIIETGSIVLNSKIFGEIIRKLPNDLVNIEVDDNNNTVIKCGNSQFNIMGIPSTEFPEIPKVEKNNTFIVSQRRLKSMIRQTNFAVGINENKQILTGSLLEFNDGEMNMVSVDGYRLALRKEKIDSDGSKLLVVIPGKTLNELSKIIKDEENSITINTTDKHVLFEFDDCLIVSRLLEGEFLNYKQIIPSQNSIKVKVKVDLLIESVERAALIITSENKKYPVKLSIILDKITVSCITDMGKVQDLINVETHGNDLEIGFNHRYLLDALKACECEEIIMEFNNSVSPCVIKAVEGDSFIYLVLPVRLKND